MNTVLYLFNLEKKQNLTGTNATVSPKMAGFEAAPVFLKQVRHWRRNPVAQAQHRLDH